MQRGRIWRIIGWLAFVLAFVNVIFIVNKSGSSANVFNYMSPILIVSAIVCLVIGYLLGLSGRVSKKFKGFPLVRGKLVSVQQTGIYTNQQPELKLEIQFTTQNGQQITTTIKQLVALVNLALFQPGMELPIRYNPQKPQSIMVDFNADVDQFSAAQSASNKQLFTGAPTVQKSVNGGAVYDSQFAPKNASSDAKHIMENGVHAQGVILSSKLTDNIVDGKSEIVLQVKVTKPDNSTYEVTTTKNVPKNGLSITAPGSIVWVYYMPGDEQNILIGWHADS